MSVISGYNHFPRIAAGLPDGVEAGVRQVAVEIAVDAAANAPVDTGALKASCTAEPLERGFVSAEGLTTEGVAWAAMAGDTESAGLRPDGRVVDYAIYQEFGTVKMAAQPFYFPAVENLRGEFPAIIETALSVALAAGAAGGVVAVGKQDLSGFGG